MSCIFVIFAETHKIPLTEIVCLRIVYAEVETSLPIVIFRFKCVLAQKTYNGTNHRKNNCNEKPPTEMANFEYIFVYQ